MQLCTLNAVVRFPSNFVLCTLQFTICNAFALTILPWSLRTARWCNYALCNAVVRLPSNLHFALCNLPFAMHSPSGFYPGLYVLLDGAIMHSAMQLSGFLQICTLHFAIYHLQCIRPQDLTLLFTYCSMMTHSAPSMRCASLRSRDPTAGARRRMSFSEPPRVGIGLSRFLGQVHVELPPELRDLLIDLGHLFVPRGLGLLGAA